MVNLTGTENGFACGMVGTFFYGKLFGEEKNPLDDDKNN